MASYNDKFGDPNVYGAMARYIEHMAGDITLQEILGPMPDLTMRQLVGKAGEAGTNHATMKLIRDSYQVITGRVTQTDSDFLGHHQESTISGAARQCVYIFGRRRMNRANDESLQRPAIGKDIFSQMIPGNAADRVFAVKLGLGPEAWVSRAMAAQRFTEITGHGMTSGISDTLFRASLLSS